MALGLELCERERLALLEHGQLRRRLVVGVAHLVAALLVGGEEAAEGDDGAGCGELGACAPSPPSPAIVTVAVEPLASAICEATVRFQMRS